MNFNNDGGSPKHSSNIPRIRVVVRKRPLTTKERKNGDIDVLEVRNPTALVVQEMK
jgi:hypothetical protein